jgi:hypothetical protein
MTDADYLDDLAEQIADVGVSASPGHAQSLRRIAEGLRGATPPIGHPGLRYDRLKVLERANYLSEDRDLWRGRYEELAGAVDGLVSRVRERRLGA